uniref:Hes family bHLH transcription factor 3 n=1 Tax=Latimeria chalumnae TaxID=7897 RepID=H3BCL5_LATCH
MVTGSESTDKSERCSFRKVSKPLMEKKRRARINDSLEQLKNLLENNFSHSIRKRKLEKADILELTVKYLKSLQNSQGTPVSKGYEYQAGFRSCLNGVNQYLLRTEEANETLRLRMLNHLVKTLPAVTGSSFSTLDSNARLLSEANPFHGEPSIKPGHFWRPW